MRMSGSTLAILLAVSAGLGRVQAQDVARVDSGTVVRLHLSGGAMQRGRLLTPVAPATAEIVYCRYPGPPCRALTAPRVDSVPRSRLTQLDEAAGSHWQRGAIVGGAIGAALGIATIAFADGLCESEGCVNASLGGAAVVLALGTGLGLVFGSTSLTWRTVW